MQNRAVFRAYCLLLGFLVILFVGLSMAKAWAIPEPGGIEEADFTEGWRLVLHLPDGGQAEYWLSAEVPPAEEGGLAWRLEEPYIPLRLLAEAAGASLGWFEYYNGTVHTGAAVWLPNQPQGDGIVFLPACSSLFLLPADGAPPIAEGQFAKPLLLDDTLCLPVQLLDIWGWQYQVEAAQVEVWLPENLPQADSADLSMTGEEALDQAWEVLQPALADFWAMELNRQLLATAETNFNPELAGRTHNIFLAAQALHGWQTAPGEEFSFNAAVGERTPERGYELATIFVGGEALPGYGGGVCQVSSTLYMALRQTDLAVLERHSHSRQVDYAPAGADATVAWGALDLRWQNNLTENVFLLCQIEGNRLRVEIWQGIAPRELPDIFKI